jgi:hypothetical protein
MALLSFIENSEWYKPLPRSNGVKDGRNKKHRHNGKKHRHNGKGATSPNTAHQCSNKLVAAFALKHDILRQENVVVLTEPKLKNGIPFFFEQRQAPGAPISFSSMTKYRH